MELLLGLLLLALILLLCFGFGKAIEHATLQLWNRMTSDDQEDDRF